MRSSKKVSHAKTPESAFNILVGLAYEVAEAKLRDGTATSQLICEILKRDSERYKLENEKLKADVEVAEAKVRQIEESVVSSEMYDKVLKAMRLYSGESIDEDDDYDD